MHSKRTPPRPARHRPSPARRAATIAVAALGACALASPLALQGAYPRAEAQQAAAPLSIAGPVEVQAGSSVPLPVKANAAAPVSGRYVVIYNAPGWLSFSNGQNVGDGIWLVERDRLADVKMTVVAGASGEQELTIGSGNRSGAIDWEERLLVKVKAAAAEAAPPAAERRVAQANPQPSGPVTWDKLLDGKSAPAYPQPGQEPPPPPPPPAAETGPKKSDAELLAEAKHLVRECTTCHSLYGQDDGIPVMVGLTVDRFMDTMDSYRREKRDHKLMQVTAKSLTEEQTRGLAMYLSRIKPAAPSDVAASGTGTAATGGSAGGTAAGAPAAQFVKREADSATLARVARWIDRARSMLDNGDIAQARLLLERAAQYGDPQAAFLLATSFDPNALPWRTGMGLVAEPLKARRWYLVAKSLGGGAEIDARLAELPAAR